MAELKPIQSVQTISSPTTTLLAKNPRPAVFIVGAFGCGKTSIVGWREHVPFDKVSTEVSGWVSIGGKLGADNLAALLGGIKAGYTDYIKTLWEKPLLIHSMIYTNKVDIERLSRTHKVYVIELITSPGNLLERQESRSGKTITYERYCESESRVCRVVSWAQHIGVTVIRIDNDRKLKTVAEEVWGHLDDIMSKQDK